MIKTFFPADAQLFKAFLEEICLCAFLREGRLQGQKPSIQSLRSTYLRSRTAHAAQKEVYKQLTATERINSQAKALGIERPHVRNGKAIANLNTLIYLLINLRFFQRIRDQKLEIE